VPRDEVVLAERVERDVLHQHQLVVALLEGRLQDVGWVNVVPGEDLFARPRHPSCSVTQAFALRILADSHQQLSNGSLRSCHVDA
jgi:hypothetical protein